MLELFRHVFDSNFMPHGHCYFWEKEILIPIVIGDGLTFISYMLIPVVLWRYVKARNDLKFSFVFKAFAAFIFFCGIGHLVDIVNIWEPYYRVSAITKMCTGLVSLGTIVLLFKFFPKALKIGLPGQVEQINKELKRQNHELEELNDFYNDTMKTVRLGYWHLDLRNNELFWSPVVYEIHEMEPGTPISVESAISYYHPDHIHLITGVVQEAIESGKPFDLDLKLITAKKNVIWVRAIGKTVYEKGKAIRLKGLFQDINESKLREQRLLESESALNEAETIAKVGSWRWYVDKDEHYWSDERFRILGYHPNEIEPSLKASFQLIHSDDRESVQQMVEQAIAERAPYEIRYRIKTKDGQHKVLIDKGVPSEDKYSDETLYLGVVRDITEEHTRERELQESLQALERSNRELQDFAYVASHDLQEPLRVITSYLQLLEIGHAEKLDDEARHFIQSIIKASARMKNLINDLLTISKLDTSPKEIEPVDLNEVLKIVCDNLEFSINESDAQIVYDNLPTVEGDRSRLEQLFQNLMSNAIKFRRHDVQPRVEITATEKGQKFRIAVSDNGIGIESKYTERIFTIFQRLHSRDEYDGTGIGLAICKKIVESHGSTFTVESEVGKGTSFIFDLKPVNK
ncbi:PAS domain-containing protein [Roseivirga sp. UBA1976]|uniref:sensor histidine kinase n=2 Tax=Roseivirga TaxID=290180 RepID=UPI0025801E00|nr:PAS domain-containing protein [Roseivirga sp. UBA1976]MEC7754855.1 PAS domain-containing protein [Bacteroidota bacterium]|tara:strand:- start:3982 stop:5874 length:1893 start_codon:yes stop_codon:yes gene_type:complete